MERPLLADHMRKSAEQHANARKVLPGGVTANIKFFEPHPIVMQKADGSKITDVDGNEYIDYLLCYGALILGHGHPKVNEAVIQQMLVNGTPVLGAPSPIESEMAEKLADLFEAIEMVRFTNSGMEATMLAIRVAVAYTGKSKIAKFEGHYHGGYDPFLVSVHPDLRKAGEARQPNAVPDSKGLSTQDLENTIVLPFNDLEATEKRLRRHADDIACVILEPVQGGFIPADQEFMNGLRKLTQELGILFIFDEVKTGFRATLGGVQSVYNIKPDLTALGKVLGGGFPIGAVGGNKEIMTLMEPDRGKDILTFGTKSSENDDVLFHSGTYNGHPTVLAAGRATIESLENGEMEKLLMKTMYFRQRLEEVYSKRQIPMQTLGWGSIFNIVLTKEPIKNVRDMSKADQSLKRKIDLELLKLGIYTKPLNRYSMSVMHSEEDIERTIQAHDEAIRRVTA